MTHISFRGQYKLNCIEELRGEACSKSKMIDIFFILTSGMNPVDF